MTSNKNNVTHETSLNGSETSTLKKGPWTSAEDAILVEYVKKHGEGNWNTVQKNSGLSRCGKSCRLRWANHLRPNLKKGSFTLEEEHLILELHGKLGNKWARMAAQLPGRTDNEIKNYWNTRVKRRQRAGLSLYPSNPNDIQKQPSSFHHHQHRPYLTQASQIPSNFTSFSSTQNHKPNFGSQIPNFSPINTSIGTSFQTHQYNTHFFSSPTNGLKRFRDNNYSFPQPLSSPQTLQPSSSFFNQKFLPPQQQKVEFNPSNFDLNTPQTIQQNQFEHKPMFPISSGFSMKLELPSDQSPHPAGTDLIDFKNNGSLTRSDSGLLDAMIQEVQAMGDSEGMKRKGLLMDQEGKCKISGLVENGPSPNTESLYGENDPKTPPLGSTGRWNYSSPAHSAIGGSRKEYTDDQMNSVEDGELSSLLDIIPSSIFDSEFYSGGGGEISNGQSSGVTDESATNLTTTTSTTAGEAAAIPEHDWITASGWDNLPEMC